MCVSALASTSDVQSPRVDLAIDKGGLIPLLSFLRTTFLSLSLSRIYFFYYMGNELSVSLVVVGIIRKFRRSFVAEYSRSDRADV